MGLYDIPTAVQGSTPAQNAGREGNLISLIIIHTTEGGYLGSVGWLSRSNADSSAHYIISENGLNITQLVKDGNTAWHAGNWPYNLRAIGIEHSWHSGGVLMGLQPSDQLYRTGANLAALKCLDNNIPPDRDHIIGHYQVPAPNNHTDPGKLWNWTKFMGYVTEAYNYYKALRSQVGGVTPTNPTTPTQPTNPSTTPGTQYFPETKCTLGGGFYQYWQKYGGLRTLGFPITDEYTNPETNLTTQVLEKAVIEYHPEISDPAGQVLALNIGWDYARAKKAPTKI